MPGGKRKGEDTMGDFFDDVNKSEEAVKKKQRKADAADADMESFFGAVSQSERTVLKKQTQQAPGQKQHQQDQQHQKEEKKPLVVAASHHAPLTFDDVDLPSESTSAGASNASYSMPGQVSTTIGAGMGVQEQDGGEPSGSASLGAGAAPVRMAAGKKWRDESLLEWPENDYRLFVGNLDKETKLDQLEKVFSHYTSFAKAKLVMNNFPEKGTNRYMCKGYGFVSFLDPMDCAKALRTENSKYCGLRPMQLKKSNWEARNRDEQTKAKRDAKKRGF